MRIMNFKKFFIVGAACLCCFSASRHNVYGTGLEGKPKDGDEVNCTYIMDAGKDVVRYVANQLKAFPVDTAKSIVNYLSGGFASNKQNDRVFGHDSDPVRADINNFSTRGVRIQIQLNTGHEGSPTYGSLIIDPSVLEYVRQNKLLDMGHEYNKENNKIININLENYWNVFQSDSRVGNGKRVNNYEYLRKRYLDKYEEVKNIEFFRNHAEFPTLLKPRRKKPSANDLPDIYSSDNESRLRKAYKALDDMIKKYNINQEELQKARTEELNIKIHDCLKESLKFATTYELKAE